MMVTLLLVMVGGAWVPAFVFPRWLQNASRYAPTRWAVDGLDGATWRGLPFSRRCAPIMRAGRQRRGLPGGRDLALPLGGMNRESRLD